MSIFCYNEDTEASDSGLFHHLGKVAYRKVSRVRISPPPHNETTTNFKEARQPSRGLNAEDFIAERRVRTCDSDDLPFQRDIATFEAIRRVGAERNSSCDGFD